MKRILFLTLLCLIGPSYAVNADTTPIDYPADNHPQSTVTMAPDPFKTALPKVSTYVPESNNASATADTIPEKELEEAVQESQK